MGSSVSTVDVFEQENVRNIKQNLYMSVKTDNLHAFKFWCSSLYSPINSNFSTWILSNAVHSKSMNILKYIKTNDEKISSEVIDDVLEDYVSSCFPDITIVMWLITYSDRISPDMRLILLELLDLYKSNISDTNRAELEKFEAILDMYDPKEEQKEEQEEANEQEEQEEQEEPELVELIDDFHLLEVCEGI